MNISYSEYRKQDAVGNLISSTISEVRQQNNNGFYWGPYADYLVRLNEQIAPTVGILTIDGVPVATEGNLSAIVGEAKSKKTFLCSALMSGMLNTQQEHLFGIEPKGDVDVLWFDTEQSRTHVQLTARRIHTLAGYDTRQNNERFRMFALREVDPKERARILFEMLQMHKPRVVVIDGISDLIYNTNDLEESERLISMLMATSSRNRCHIFVVLHTNPNSDKARGHIGSALLRKAETVLYVHKAGDCSIVEPQFCRNEPFERFAFRINSEGLPEACEVPATNGKGRYDDIIEVIKALGGTCIERKTVVSKLMEQRGLSETNARVRITRAIRQGFVAASEDGNMLSVG